MPDIKQEILAVTKVVEQKVQEVENVHPGMIWTTFEEFFQNYAKEHNVNKNWIKVVKQHVKDQGVLRDQSKWLAAVKHFGI